MAVDYTVDYSKYKNSSTYTTSKSLYKDSKDIAKKADTLSNIQFGLTLGSTLGSPFAATAPWATFALAAGGAGIGWLVGANGGGITTEKDKFNVQLKSDRNTFSNNAISMMENSNTSTTKLKGFMNRTKSSYDETYGKGSYAKIEEAVMGILGLSNSTVLSKVIADLQYDNIAGEMKSRLVSSEYGEGIYEEGDITKLLEANFSLADLGKGYTDMLYETYMADTTTEIGDAARQLSENLDDTMNSILDNANSMQSQFAQQFLSAFFNQKESDLSSALSRGAVESSQSSSGLRTTKSSSNMSKVQRYKEDLARASYVATIEYYKSQLSQSINSLETSRTQSYKQYQNSLGSLKRQIRTGVNESINQMLYGVGSEMNEKKGYQQAEGDYVAQTMAANDMLDDGTNVQDILTKPVTVANATK